ncbi:hypothetical protein KVA01_02160 [Kocuria varians]|uniref:RNA polymerase sigma-70 region 2 domain-containing protein n=1 Tax=Kocuria varians TaxID=1272 RepID=A0A4Y4CYV2_KOCVA|nr:sigma-70 family RNA polymerase sigma factor [Kocuria varians]GEC98061.1 hypothetical protein KVA01_02160 [Kocuria varians]
MTHSAAPRSGRPTGPDDLPASDETLLTAVRQGDSSAFAELYERHRGAALAVARMHSRNESDAQDLVSEAFIRVLGLLQEGRGPREFLRAYLVTAVSRLAADRANELSRTRPEDPQPYGVLDRVELFDDTVVRQVDSAVVARAFASLPERWQEILWYLEVEGRRPRQVASVVGAQPNAVSALGKRAREGLRAAYMQEHVSAQALANCSEFSSQLGAFARGSLTPSRTKVVQGHLDECRRCTAEYLQLQDLGLGLRGWVLPVLAGLPLWGGEGTHLATALAGTPLVGTGGAAVVAAESSVGAGSVGAGSAGATSAGAASADATAAGVAGSGASGTGATAASGGAVAATTSGTGFAIAAAAVLVAAVAAAGVVVATNTSEDTSVSSAVEPTGTPAHGSAGATSALAGPRASASGAALADGPAFTALPQGQREQDVRPAQPSAVPSLPITVGPVEEGTGQQDTRVPLLPPVPGPATDPAVDPVQTGDPVPPAVDPTPEPTTPPVPTSRPTVTQEPTSVPTPVDPGGHVTPSPCSASIGIGGVTICL